jgi:putative copper resistance protein D
MAVCYSRTRHASTLDPVWGFFSQSLHVLAVAVWLGLLLLFAWFAGERVNWKSVLKWFTPLSISCMAIIIAAGIMIMFKVSSEYVSAWVLPYGQALLLKHLLMIPLLMIAFLNGFLYYYKLKKDPSFDPRSWFKAEGVVAVLILAVTAYMSQQAPPHEVSQTLIGTEPSSLFLYWYQGVFDPSRSIQLVPAAEGMMLALLAAVMFTMIVFCYLKFKRLPVFFVASAVILGMITSYLSAMLMIK